MPEQFDNEYEFDETDTLNEDVSGDDIDTEDQEDDLIICPSCNTEVFAESQHCPECGQWILDADRENMVWSPARRTGFRIIVFVILGCLVASSLALVVVGLFG